ncbi:MAG: hypothetical protein A3A58_01535 [Candidatus Blackburnbacteria bacterium RIFCSPLOWO2_01_FULL_41_27]|uniref:CHASE domain-containing protein n=2 Tax=Candidatus Blackburniibacteriota TaxID=1817898 RepID=A0A1G1VBT4_9BACT|nr:MAG: hypothetical protein A3F61_04560 [Candidatus Blackburnbacteria bacterium RIFCSPHIGHO2_12_FULL_41_13b]OGY14329.1 MAG: hypothetical protein A3A58_01535 [Candidatus Blackburnbacteria bacterium RIFCSPLOWO2_01_FULL_41_27]
MYRSALHSRFLVTTFTIFFIFLIVTFSAYKITSDVVEQESKNRFYQDVSDLKNRLQTRFNLYILSINGLHGFVDAKGQVTRNEWSTYIKKLGIIEKYPGISSLLYIERVSKENLKSFEESVRRDTSLDPQGNPDFKVYPKTESSEYFIVKYIEPFEGREQTLGYDFSSEEKRKKVLEQSRKTGAIASTGKITNIITQKPGFGIFLPFYDAKMIIQNSELERMNNLQGFVYAAFRADEMFKTIIGQNDPFPNLDFEIYENDQLTAETLLYDHDPNHTISDSHLQTKETLDIDSQTWTILICNKGSGLSLTQSQQTLPWIVLASGLAFSFIFLGLFLYRFKQHLANYQIIKKV